MVKSQASVFGPVCESKFQSHSGTTHFPFWEWPGRNPAPLTNTRMQGLETLYIRLEANHLICIFLVAFQHTLDAQRLQPSHRHFYRSCHLRCFQHDAF